MLKQLTDKLTETDGHLEKMKKMDEDGKKMVTAL